MNLHELKETLKTANLHLIHLEGSPLDHDIRGNIFIGNLEEYIEAVHVLGASAVFIFTKTLEDQDFQYELQIDNEEFEGDPEEIDLCKSNPMLEKYKDHIGQVGVFKLSIPIPEAHINFYMKEDWWLEFTELLDETTDRIDEDQEAALAQQRAAQEVEERKFLKSLGGLICDADFVRLPTQRSMIEYAKEKIPGLETVDAITLKDEIRNLNAKIKAKGLGSKRKV